MITMEVVDRYKKLGKESVTWRQYADIRNELVKTYGISDYEAGKILRGEDMDILIAKVYIPEVCTETLNYILSEMSCPVLFDIDAGKSWLIVETEHMDGMDIVGSIPAEALGDICRELENHFYPTYVGGTSVTFRDNDLSESDMFSYLPNEIIEIGYDDKRTDMVYFIHAKHPSIKFYVCIFN